MTSFKTLTHRRLTSIALRDRLGSAEIPPPVDAEWLPEGSGEHLVTATAHDAAAEPGPEVWYG